MNTSEVAKRMLDGEIGVLGNFEYSWQEFRFYVRVLGSSERWYSTEIPKSNNWQIKKEPIKYEKYVWLNKEPTDGNNLGDLLPYLFGATYVLWNPKKAGECNKRYKITVEECPENE